MIARRLEEVVEDEVEDALRGWDLCSFVVWEMDGGASRARQACWKACAWTDMLACMGVSDSCRERQYQCDVGGGDV